MGVTEEGRRLAITHIETSAIEGNQRFHEFPLTLTHVKLGFGDPDTSK